ncbi:hypothetical protein MF406_12545 [Georgenia sp. TF02-10]|uniref:hypothetical protein n=1 Tax=Georgenia sp. TF02-10 TaxID=2917725 RepID=UPI001FA79101|nr:hypothetical protein [Georgenia sp. TF02-10]UNX53804.1 hypothetical protein MF406_12545 [Georgenia sp. TF02-10]
MTVSLLPTRPSSTPHATVALDLTGLGARTHDPSGDLPVEKADLARLASYTRAAHDAGVDFVALGDRFRLRSDHAVRPEGWRDPVLAARRIGPHAGTAGIVPAVPLRRGDLTAVADELAQVPHNGSWAGVQLGAPGAGRDALAAALRAVTSARDRRTGGRAPAPRVVLPVSTAEEVELAGEFGDVVRIREHDLEWARELRYAVRAAARTAGRPEVRVLVDLHTVISTDRAAARERAGLVADIAGDDAPWAGALSAVGTVQDAADTVQTWLTAGAADGFVVLPGSLPADVLALLRGLLPELRARGLVAEQAVADRPTVRRAAAAGAAGATGGAGRATPAAVRAVRTTAGTRDRVLAATPVA